MKNNLSAVPFFRNGKCPFVPYRIHKIGISYSRKPAFGAEGNGYFKWKITAFLIASILSGACIINVKIPFSVETLPVLTDKLRPRIFVS